MGELGIIGENVSAILNDVIYNDKKQNITNIKYEYDNQTLDVGIKYNSTDSSYTYTKDGSTVSNEDDHYNLY